MTRLRRTALRWMTICVFIFPSVGVAEGWPRFRGPNGTGIATARSLPIEWSAEDYAWQTSLPGIGHSSPVVGKGRVFVTTASDDGTSRQMVCLNAADGQILWSRELTLKTDHLHTKNSHASGTPALGDDLVVVPFADDDRLLVTAFDFDGAQVWSRDLGPFESQHGHGASPIIWRNLVIVPNDQDGTSTLVALDLRSGEIIWTSPRSAGDASYSTPFIFKTPSNAPQLIACCKAMGVTSLDPATGKLNWQSGSLPQRTVGSPIFADGLIYQSCGQGGRGTLMVGVDPFAKSDEMRLVYEEKKLLPYVPTPIGVNGHLYLWNDNGVVVCVDSKTRKPVWTERIGGNYSASPVCVNGLLYNVSEEGEVVVMRASPNYELLGRSSLGERSHATPAIADGKMFFRTFHKVLCLAPTKGR